MSSTKSSGRGFTTLLTVFLVLTVVLLVNNVNGNINMHRRFEYKYSFKPPYLAQKDGTVPFWEYGGNAIASSDSVRVAPSLKSQKGAIWTKSRTTFDWWEVEIVFRVSGRGRVGADGLAFWYTSERGDFNGDVFGSSDKWVGLGLFFDSFDNDNKHNNPYIMAMLNDGTKLFDHQNDASSQLLAGCLRDFRNKPYPTRVRVTYFQNTLTILIHNGMTKEAEDYEMCAQANGVVLPKNGYFGLSAATGGLADDHDVFHFLTTSLHAPGQIVESDNNRVPEAESQKLSLEYQEYQKKLEQQKEDYRKEHPDQAPKDDDDFFESDSQRELRQIWQAQTAVHDSLRDLSKKMDDMVARQDRTMGLLATGAQGQGGAGIPAGSIQLGDSIKRQEVDILINNQNSILATAREIRTLVSEISARSETIINNQARQPTAQVQSTSYDMQTLISEMRDGMNSVKQGVAEVSHRIIAQPASQHGCPTPNCLGLTAFLAVTAVQLALMLCYSIYKGSREAQAKKFY